MNPYPKITDIKSGLSSDGWTWQQQDTHHNHWIGTDEAGQKWMVKMSGKRNAIREHSFSRFGQHLGINTQSSKYIILSSRATPLQLQRRAAQFQKHQLALWFYPEHANEICGNLCPLKKLSGTDWQTAWPSAGIHNPWDRCLGEILG